MEPSLCKEFFGMHHNLEHFTAHAKLRTICKFKRYAFHYVWQDTLSHFQYWNCVFEIVKFETSHLMQLNLVIRNFLVTLKLFFLSECSLSWSFNVQQGLEIRGFWFQKKTVQLKTVLREVYTYVLNGIFFQKTVYLQGFWSKSAYLKVTVM